MSLFTMIASDSDGSRVQVGICFDVCFSRNEKETKITPNIVLTDNVPCGLGGLVIVLRRASDKNLLVDVFVDVVSNFGWKVEE